MTIKELIDYIRYIETNIESNSKLTNRITNLRVTYTSNLAEDLLSFVQYGINTHDIFLNGCERDTPNT
jgi:hypothetical protein